MPIYEYECVNCGKFEEVQQINEEKLKKCPKCNGDIRRLISLNASCDVIYNSKEHYEKVIKPDAKKIAEKIRNGDENAAADLFGEK